MMRGLLASARAMATRCASAPLRSRPLESFTGRVVRIGLESDRVTQERRVYVRGESPPARVYLGEQVEF
jgi:HlyD family secretion protein